ncbi:MAG: OmpA family protein [Myxococcota bacterium]
MDDTGGTLTGGGLVDSKPGAEGEIGRETGIFHELGPPVEVGLGGGGGCATAPGLTWTFLLVWLIRALLMVPLMAHGADFQQLQGLDGGRFVSVRSPDPGPRWSGRVALTTQSASKPLTVVMEDLPRRVLVNQLYAGELGATFNFGDLVGAGFAVPMYAAVGPLEDHGAGDVSLWAIAPLTTGENRASIRVMQDLPTQHRDPAVDQFWGQSATSVTWAGENPVGGFTLGWHTGVRFQRKNEIRGLVVGNRIDGGVGVHRALGDRLGLTVECFGNGPLALPKTIRQLPMEALVSGDLRVLGTLHARASVGLGLTRAAGTPENRVAVQVVASGHEPRDNDGDGLSNLIDQCRNDPEDRDGFEDRDGCPDPDNDGDGILDPVDACPDVPEVVNGFQDEDGCPDEQARWTVLVTGPEVFTITADGESHKRLAGETWSVLRGTGQVIVRAEAEGFHTQGRAVTLYPGENVTEIALEPIRLGQLVVQVADPDGAPIPEALLEVGDEEVELVDGWYTGTHAVGELPLRAEAIGWEGVRTVGTVSVGGVTTVRITLERQDIHLDGEQLVLDDSPLFALDSARLVDTSWLDALALWLRAHPEVRVLRVEGHADSLGGSAYNLALSDRRAQVVVDALVERGVERERLAPLGSGEAYTRAGARRMVSFTVLVHSEW